MNQINKIRNNRGETCEQEVPREGGEERHGRKQVLQEITIL
jgi:hypothetical protein